MNTFFADPARYNLSDLVDHILIIQTDYSWPKEAECLENHGLKTANRVLDIGTGNGHFLCRMAERYPDKQFVGIETSEPLIERASQIAREMNPYRLTALRYWFGGHAKKHPSPELLNFGSVL